MPRARRHVAYAAVVGYLIDCGPDCGTIVSRVILQRVYDGMAPGGDGKTGHSHDLDGDSLDPEHHLFVIDAFEMPSWNYSNERKTFERYTCTFLFHLLNTGALKAKVQDTNKAGCRRECGVSCSTHAPSA